VPFVFLPHLLGKRDPTTQRLTILIVQEKQLHSFINGHKEKAMIRVKSRQVRTFISFLAGIVFCVLCVGGIANAQQRRGLIEPGTNIMVRTTEDINTHNGDGQIFHGAVDQDVVDRTRHIIIPRGSDAELIARRISRDEVALDLESITIYGVRHGVEATETAVGSSEPGIGANRRTGEYVGGGAVLGAIIGAIAGGGKGAAIGAGAGAATGAGTQILTRGHRIEVPAESLLTFNLTEPLRAGVMDRGYQRNGYHYHPGYGNAQYEQGLRDGRTDVERNIPWSAQNHRFRNEQDRQEYESGYNDGYQYRGGSELARQKPGYGGHGTEGNINIGADNFVSWQARPISRIYVQVDNQAPRLFASGQNGSEPAPWMQPGHIYTFILQDANGTEIARAARDMRRPTED
jgi:hypothetical protein